MGIKDKVHYKPLIMSGSEEDDQCIQFQSTFNFDSYNDFSSIFKYSSTDKSLQRSTVEQKGYIKVCSYIIICLAYFLVVITMPVSLIFSLKSVREHERMVVFRLGRYYKTYKPGLSFKLPLLDKCTVVSIQQKAFSVPPQKILTQDGAAIQIGADVYYQIIDPVKCISSIQDLNHSLRELSHSVICSEITQRHLSDIECNRAIFLDALRSIIAKLSSDWGVSITKVEINDILIIEAPQNPLAQLMPSFKAIESILLPPGSTRPSQNLVPLNVEKSIPRVETDDAVQLDNEIDDILNKIKSILSEKLVEEINVTYAFRIEKKDDKVDEYFLDLKNNSGSVGKGSISSPDVILSMSHSTFWRLFHGEQDAFSAYMSGDLVIEGNVRDARKLDNLLEHFKTIA